MDLIQYSSQWAKGDMLQGRIMLVIGVLILITSIAILRSDNSFLRGSLIPLSLMLVMLLGYGGFLALTRSAHAQNVKEMAQYNPQEAVKNEYAKAEKDVKAYTALKPIWLILIIVSAALYFAFKTQYLKGLSAGLIFLFLSLLIVDSTLHQRLKPYFDKLSELINTAG